MVTHLASELGNCRIDPTQFEVALLNILINARDAMNGQGTVTIRTSNIVVNGEDARSFSGLEPGRYAAIAVSDTGPGIPPELIHRVMESFFTTKEEGKGTGLGLSMVHGFAKQSGGGAYLCPDTSVGTTIRLYFPVALKDEERAGHAATRARGRGGREPILVVDDRPEILHVAKSLLEELGYDVLSASSGVDASQRVEMLCSDVRPALLFSDVVMPCGMNGFMLARRLRQQLPRIKVLLTAGYAGDVLGVGSESNSAF